MSNDQELTSIKELASQLKSSDALIKKIIKDFEIETVRDQKKVGLNAESVKTIRDILALRASGKKNNEIKELFYESKKTPTKASSKAEKVEAVLEVKEEVKAEAEIETKSEPKTEAKAETKTEQVEAAGFDKRGPRHKKPKFKDKREKTELNDEDTKLPKLTAQEIAEMQETEAIEKDKREVLLDLSQYMDEDTEETGSELKALLDDSDEETLEDLDDEEDIDEADEVEEIDGKLSPRKIRRRQFSFRYIQRQIANDSKRVNYLKQKLKRGKLSAKERMNVEESLYHRSNLLNGWVHLLRWVKS